MGILIIDDLIETDWMNDFGQWLRENVKPGKSIEDSSIAAYGFDIGQYANWYRGVYGEEFHPSKCNRVDFRSFQKFCEEQHVKPATWNRRKVALSKLSAWAQAKGWILEDAARDLVKMNQVMLAPKWMADKDHRKFVRQLEADVNAAKTETQIDEAVRNRAMCMLMLAAGLRVSEVVNLRWGDLETRDRSGKAVIYNSKRMITGEVPLAIELRKALVEWDKLHDKFSQSYIFPGEVKDQPLDRRSVERVVEGVSKRAGLEDVTPHTLRHTCCHLVERKYGLVVANKLMRHKSLSTTMRYATPSMDELQAAVDGIEI